MRLRAISEHLKKQNWLAVFLDFVLVVVGVYLGLVLNEARENAQIQQRARASLGLLLEDVSGYLDRLDYVAGAQEMRIAALKRAADGLVAKAIDEAAVAKDVQIAVENSRTVLARETVYDAMVQDGELLVLPKQLRSLISDTYAADYKFLTTASMQYWNNQDMVRANCLDRYWSWDDGKLISRAPEEVARLRNCFADLRAYSDYYTGLVKVAHRQNAEKLKVALQAELGAAK